MSQRRRDIRDEARFESIEDPSNPERYDQALVPARPAERVKPARHVSRDPSTARRVGEHWRLIVASIRPPGGFARSRHLILSVKSIVRTSRLAVCLAGDARRL